LLAGLAAVVAISFGTMRGQQLGASSEQPPIRAEVTLVNMLFTVTDKRGRLITDLNKDDFQVFENRKQQSILEFASEIDLPLRLAVLLNTSNSVRDRFRFQQEAATNFISNRWILVSRIRPGIRPTISRASSLAATNSTRECSYSLFRCFNVVTTND
jgi:hypothetical protein